MAAGGEVGADGQIKLGVRPEKIHLEAADGADPDAGWNWVEGVLQMATYVGVSHQYTVDGPEGRTLTVYAQNLGSTPVPPQGSKVRLKWRPDHTFVVRRSDPLADWEEEL
jgi:spermidine/putrescine transport system ATP-binding protein